MTIYFVESSASEQRELLCRWAEKFSASGERVQVVVGSTQGAQFIDQLMWTFSQSGFIPHSILGGEQPDLLESVIIVIGEKHIDGFRTVICDMQAGLDFMMGFETAVHFILRDDEERRQESRQLWRKAKDAGLNVVHVPYGRPPEPV